MINNYLEELGVFFCFSYSLPEKEDSKGLQLRDFANDSQSLFINISWGKTLIPILTKNEMIHLLKIKIFINFHEIFISFHSPD